MMKKFFCVAAIVSLTACSGFRTTDESYSSHAESFNILFLQIPGGDTHERAMKLVPEGGDIKTITSSPKDLTSVFGVLNRILGLDVTRINGTINKE